MDSTNVINCSTIFIIHAHSTCYAFLVGAHEMLEYSFTFTFLLLDNIMISTFGSKIVCIVFNVKDGVLESSMHTYFSLFSRGPNYS
jgi:hypothetical protein